MSLSITVTAASMATMEDDTRRAFPEECCGMMLGTIDDDGLRTVNKIIVVTNTNSENRKRRFLIEPKDLLRAEREARQSSLEVIGVYHSHPNHPSMASEFDREHAMPYWSYLILSCIEGRIDNVQSFRLKDDRSAFDEETLQTGS